MIAPTRTRQAVQIRHRGRRSSGDGVEAVAEEVDDDAAEAPHSGPDAVLDSQKPPPRHKRIETMRDRP